MRNIGRAYGFMGIEVPEPAGTRRSLNVRCPVLPDWCLPYLRVRVDFRVGKVLRAESRSNRQRPGNPLICCQRAGKTW